MKVSNHIVSETIFNYHILNLVCRKEVADIQCLSSLTGALLAILFK